MQYGGCLFVRLLVCNRSRVAAHKRRVSSSFEQIRPDLQVARVYCNPKGRRALLRIR